MTRALLLALLVRWAGRLLALAAVVIFLAAGMGFVDWVGALALWIVLFMVGLTHGAVHDLGDEGSDR